MSKTEKNIKTKDHFTQDIVFFSVKNGAVKTAKSVLYLSVVKALFKNAETAKIINK